MKRGAVGVSAICASIIVAWYAHFRPSDLSYDNLPFPAHSPVVAGEAVILQVIRCNRSDSRIEYPITRELVGTGEPIILSADKFTMKPGCSTRLSVAHMIPKGTPPGRYFIDGYANVPGPWHSDLVHFYSEPFEVVEGK